MSARRTLWIAAVAALVLAGGRPAPSAAQPDGGGAQTPVFTEVVDVRVVNVEVVVTDRRGNRVTGLAAEDFELRVDGQPQPIDYFSEVREGTAVAGADAARAVPALEAGSAVATDYLVFVDEYFSITRDRDRVLGALEQQLVELGPRDRMAIVRYDGDELEMLTTWTGDRAELADALRRAKGRKSLGLQRVSEMRQVRGGPQIDPLPFRGALDPNLTVEERYWVERLIDQQERVITAAVSTLRGFAAPRGRKVFLLLSGGWPFDPVEYVVDDFTRSTFDVLAERGGRIWSPLIDTANLLGYTIYPVDVPGLQTTSVGVDQSTPPQTFLQENNVHHSLRFLADATGGEAQINARRLDALAATAADTRSYYWLGFTPQRQGDDERHAIEVRVRGDGLRVRTRNSYFDFSRQSEVTLAVESALRFGTPPSAQPLRVEIGRGERAGVRRMTVPLAMAIPADALTLLPGPDGFTVQLELRVAVLDEDGAAADTPVVPLTLQLAERPEPGAVLRYATELRMRRKPHDLVVAVYDVPSGTILSSKLEVSP